MLHDRVGDQLRWWEYVAAPCVRTSLLKPPTISTIDGPRHPPSESGTCRSKKKKLVLSALLGHFLIVLLLVVGISGFGKSIDSQAWPSMQKIQGGIWLLFTIANLVLFGALVRKSISKWVSLGALLVALGGTFLAWSFTGSPSATSVSATGVALIVLGCISMVFGLRLRRTLD